MVTLIYWWLYSWYLTQSHTTAAQYLRASSTHWTQHSTVNMTSPFTQHQQLKKDVKQDNSYLSDTAQSSDGRCTKLLFLSHTSAIIYFISIMTHRVSQNKLTPTVFYHYLITIEMFTIVRSYCLVFVHESGVYRLCLHIVHTRNFTSKIFSTKTSTDGCWKCLCWKVTRQKTTRWTLTHEHCITEVEWCQRPLKNTTWNDHLQKTQKRAVQCIQAQMDNAEGYFKHFTRQALLTSSVIII